MRSVLFLVITHHTVVISYWHYGTTYRSHLQGPRNTSRRNPWRTSSLLKMGIIRCPKTLISNYHHAFIPLACAECDDSLLFSGASSIPLCYVLFPATLLHQLFVHPLSPQLAIYFLVYLSILLFPNSYKIPFWEFYFLPISFLIVIYWAQNSSKHFPYKNVQFLSISLC